MRTKALSKTNAWFFLFLAVLLLAMAGCSPAEFYVRVALIEGVPETGEAGTPLILTGTVRPSFASNKDIVWRVKDAGTTRASISGNVLNTVKSGIVIIEAIIANGMSEGSDYTQDFEIVFTGQDVITDIAVKTQPAILAYSEGEPLDLSGLVVTLTFSDDSAEDAGLADFAAKGITTSPAQGTELTISHNGQPVTVTAGAYSADTDNLTVEKGIEIISYVSLTVNGPAKNDAPDTAAGIADGGHYTAGAISWSPADNPFRGETAYTATVTVTADEDCKFTNRVTAAVNGKNAAVSGNTGTAVTISYTFAPTQAKAVANIEIISQPAKLTYTHGNTLDLDGLSVKLTYDDNTTEDAALAGFTARNISANPANGITLSHAAHNGKPVIVSIGSHQANTLNLEVNKADGAAVSAPSGTGNAASLGITITAVTPPGNGQTVEYAINTTTAVPVSGWQDEKTFSGLNTNTPYYIFARSKENANYNVGTASRGAASITFYTVTFDSTGGSDVASQYVLSGGKAAAPDDPAKIGYKFGGWYKEASLIYKWNFNNDTVIENIFLYAKWIKLYTVSFDPNGGNPLEDQSVEQGGYAARPGDPVKAGDGFISYSFINWYSDPGLTTIYNFSTPVTGDITLYAKWVELISGISIEVTGPAKGETPDTSAESTESGVSYTAGAVSWWPNDDPFKGSTHYTATVTITAKTGSKFTESLTAKINGHDAVISGRTDTTVRISHTFDETLPKAIKNIEINSQPVKTAYTHGDTLNLAGLSVKLTFDDNTTEIVALGDFGDIISENPANGSTLSRTAHDNQPVIVSIGIHHASTNNLTVKKANGAPVGKPSGTGNAASRSITVTAVPEPGNGQTVEYAVGTTTAVPASGWQDGRTFSGLNTNTPYYIFARSKENDNYNTGTASVSNGTVAFYTVTFNSNGGSTVSARNAVSGETVTEPADPVNGLYYFGGWYRDNGTWNLPWDFTTDTVTSPITLYAKWIQNTLVITLEVEQIINADPNAAITNSTLSRTGTGNIPQKAQVTVVNAANYDSESIKWEISGAGAYAGETITGTGASFEIDATNFKYNTLGGHVLRLEVKKAGTTYRVNIRFYIVD